MDTELKESSTRSEYNKIHEELKIKVDKLREQIMTNKLKKFERDTRDYQYNKVYKWAWERRKNRRAQSGGYTTSSDGTDRESESQGGAWSNRKTFQKRPHKIGGCFLEHPPQEENNKPREIAICGHKQKRRGKRLDNNILTKP